MFTVNKVMLDGIDETTIKGLFAAYAQTTQTPH